ncbi:MAG: hypothetical protein EBT92_19320 [Planctomycetes bacterium]|nr:hypothetical protein [Planctomycetota bacterium]
MLDWPDPSQTSPIKTSLIAIVFLPLISRVWGPPAESLSSLIFHLPSAPALVVCDCVPIFTVTSSLGSAQPHTGGYQMN